MTLEKLEIIKLDQSGQATRRLSCLVGRISVLRSSLDQELCWVRDALMGRDNGKHYNILVDQAKFESSAVAYVGFSDSFNTQPDLKLGEFLSQAGIAADKIDQLLSYYGLSGLTSALCLQLSHAQQRLLRLLALSKLHNKIIVLNDPFLDLSGDWREKAAELLCNVAHKQKNIVVVVSLLSRPEAWVENEYVSRLQIERPRQATVGFGSDAVAANDEIKKLRAQIMSEKLSQENIGGKYAFLTPKAVIFGLAYLVLFGTALIQLSAVLQTPAPVIVVKATEEVKSEVETAYKSEVSEYALDNYPVAVKDAIEKSFNNPEAVVKGQVMSPSFQVPRQLNNETQLQPTQPHQQSQLVVPAASFPVQQEAQLESPEFQEQRREEIRQRFLSAIMKSREER